MNKDGKLVRDKIPEIIENSGKEPIIRVLDDTEYKEELLKKLYEEYNEVIEAKTKEETLEECSDVLEVLIALLEYNGYTLEYLLKCRDEKKEKRGAFQKRLYLVKVK